MENKDNNKLDEKDMLDTSDYPRPVFGNFITGLVFIILCIINLPTIKFSEYVLLKIFAFIAVCLGSSAAVGYIRIAWNNFDFNKEAKRLLDEKDR